MVGAHGGLVLMLDMRGVFRTMPPGAAVVVSKPPTSTVSASPGTKPVLPLSGPLTVALPAPVTVRPKLATTPPSDSVAPAADELMVLAEPSVTWPATVLLPPRLTRAPLPPMPVPLRASASGVVMPPWSSSSAPGSTVVPLTGEPKAAFDAPITVPALSWVRPV
jgi:hypothetical protein